MNVSATAGLVRSVLCSALLCLGVLGCGTQEGGVPDEAAGSSSMEVASVPPPAETPVPVSGLSAEELALEPDEPQYEEPAIDVADAAQPLALEIYSERGYEDADGRLVLDLLERDYAYLSVVIRDAEGRPVRGARPQIRTDGESRIVPMAGANDVSDELGIYAFGVTGGVMGAEDISVSLSGVQRRILLNVISLRASGYAGLDEVEGAVDWGLLVQAKFRWGETLTAEFPDAVAQLNGETVRLAGFMMPLEMSEKQAHFVMTSNPPDCFFHIPGGPAGAVEVFARKAIPVSWDPIVL